MEDIKKWGVSCVGWALHTRHKTAAAEALSLRPRVLRLVGGPPSARNGARVHGGRHRWSLPPGESTSNTSQVHARSRIAAMLEGYVLHCRPPRTEQ